MIDIDRDVHYWCPQYWQIERITADQLLTRITAWTWANQLWKSRCRLRRKTTADQNDHYWLFWSTMTRMFTTEVRDNYPCMATSSVDCNYFCMLWPMCSYRTQNTHANRVCALYETQKTWVQSSRPQYSVHEKIYTQIYQYMWYMDCMRCRNHGFDWGRYETKNSKPKKPTGRNDPWERGLLIWACLFQLSSDMQTRLPRLPYTNYGKAIPDSIRSSARANPRSHPRTDLKELVHWDSFPNEIHEAILSAMTMI